MYQFSEDNHLKANYVVKRWQYLPFQQKRWKYPSLCNWKTLFCA